MSKYQHHTKTYIFLLAAVLLLFLLSACSTNTTNSTNTSNHKTYNYNYFVVPAALDNLHAGEQFTLTWTPTRGRDSTEATRTQITISAELFGPFTSPNFIDQDISTPENCSTNYGNVVASITQIHADDWSNKTYFSALSLPQSLVPGYYELVQKVSYNGNGNGGCSTSRGVVQIKA
jgi:hypothetical protein